MKFLSIQLTLDRIFTIIPSKDLLRLLQVLYSDLTLSFHIYITKIWCTCLIYSGLTRDDCILKDIHKPINY